VCSREWWLCFEVMDCSEEWWLYALGGDVCTLIKGYVFKGGSSLSHWMLCVDNRSACAFGDKYVV
jgi:hypothetical protein